MRIRVVEPPGGDEIGLHTVHATGCEGDPTTKWLWMIQQRADSAGQREGGRPAKGGSDTGANCRQVLGECQLPLEISGLARCQSLDNGDKHFADSATLEGCVGQFAAKVACDQDAIEMGREPLIQAKHLSQPDMRNANEPITHHPHGSGIRDMLGNHGFNRHMS
jgi:hypothetical protein